MTYNVKYSNQALKFLRRSDNELVKRILDKIEKLKENPFPSDVKRAEGFDDKVFRVRVGKHRILYEAYHEEKLIVISKIDKRERVYD